MIRLALLASLACLAGPAAAQSLYGCTDLAGRHAFASVEGAEGVFYQVHPDLEMDHAISAESAEDLGRLSEALASLGTTLVYVPLPTKALAMPQHLPQAARDLGFDPVMAATVQAESLERLEARGVRAVDARRALRAGAAPFLAADPRLSAEGARLLAAAVAEAVAAAPASRELPRGRFESRSTGPVMLASEMRAALQRHCDQELPEVVAEGWATARLSEAGAADNALLGAEAAGPSVALLGTEVSGEAASNLAGFLAEATGLDVAAHAVEGGGAFAAISAYLTSRAFQEARPAFLVWVVPVSDSLAGRGDQPMRELIAAAGGSCRTSLPAGPGPGGTLAADLRGLDPTRPTTLLVDAGGAEATEARFDFVSAAGLVRSRSVVRHPLAPTGRFYVPLSGLWPEGTELAEVTLDVPFGPDARVTACAE